VARALARARAVEARERWPRERLELHQRASLRALVAHVAPRSAFYRRAWGGVPDADVTIEQLPVVRRADLMASFDEAVTDPRVRREVVDRHLASVEGDPLLFGEHRVMASSGSTGEPGRFVYSRAGWDAFLDGMMRWTRWMGIRPRWPRLRIAAIGAPDARHMTFRGAASIDVGIFDTLRLSATEPIERLAAALSRHRPDAINAYPSVLELLAEEHLAGRLQISPRVLCTSSEQRTAATTARIEAAFGVRPFDCYALTETGVTAVDCERHDGLHVFEDLSIVEVREGRVLMTNLHNDALPMIRVEVSDLLVEKPGPCPCGRSFRRLEAVEGRADDLLRLRRRDGEAAVIHPLRLRARLGAIAGVVQYRIDWHPDRVRMDVVSPAPEHELRAAIQAAFRSFADEHELDAPPLEMRRVPSIPREPSAKLKVVRQFHEPMK
jgi:phenylacetate-coenzyme A ligase PaaK-like adenylate-forming protein